MKLNQTQLKSIFIASLALATCIAAWATIDNIDLPFKDDPAVIGRWQSVAFVQSPEQFSSANGQANADLFLKEVSFLPQGKTPSPNQTWTQGVLINSASKTASKYTFKKFGELEYMFLEWKSGDYTIRNRPPEYHVLIREADASKRPKPSTVEVETTDVSYSNDCLVTFPAGGICRQPGPSIFRPRSLNDLPRYDPNSGKMWQLDLRGVDISKLPLEGRTEDLLHSDFDTKTKFPKYLPKGFTPELFMALGKNPGLGVRKLHKEGITGQGVSMAIIDQALLVDHKEYAQRLKSYEEVHWSGPEASMHGGAVASIAVGKDCGVAPGADLYYIADRFWNNQSVMNYIFLAKAVDRVIVFNESLPKANKIRVLAIARGFEPYEKGYAEIMDAIGRAKKAGIFVVTSSLEKCYGFEFNGLGRRPMANPDIKTSYAPGEFWQNDFFSSGRGASSHTLLVPMDSRTTAGPGGVDDYAFYREGGWSWSIPYIAGLYALACQVNPGITPEVFWKKALDTGDVFIVKKGGKEFRLEKIVNPFRLIRGLKKQKSVK